MARNLFTQAVEEVRASGRRVTDLTVSNPTRVGLRYDSAAILGALCSERVLDYDPEAKGLLAARQAVARYYAGHARGEGEGEVARHLANRNLRRAADLDPERIVLTTSTSEGYSFVFRLLCNAGDELLVPKPSYPLFEFLADLGDVKLVPYPLIYDHGWQMDFPSMAKAVTPNTRGVVVVHPNNPTGSYVQESEIGQVNAFCREFGLALVVDEVFLDYRLGSPGAKGRARESRDPGAGTSAPTLEWSFARNHEVLTFTLSGLSKISALPQMKVAWIVTSGPEQQVQDALARLEVIADTYLSMNAPIQWALPLLLAQKEDIQRQLLERVRNNLTELDRQLASQTACERLSVEGGWYAVLRVPVTRSDEDLAIALVKEKAVIVHPGHFYDYPTDGYLVVSLIAEEGEFGEGCGRVLGFLNS